MKEIILDFTKCKNAKSYEELYQVIKEALRDQFPFEYGNNADALWDVMSYAWDEDIHFKMYGVYDLEYRYLQMQMENIIGVFEDVHENTPNVTFEIVS